MISLLIIYLATRKKGSLPDSISEIAYILPSWVFTVWMAIVGMCAVYSTADKLPDDWQFVPMFIGLGLFLVAASPYYRSEAVDVHYIGGWMAAIFSMVFVAIDCPWALLGWLAFVPFVKYSKRVLVAEIICGLILLISLVI